MLLQKNFFNVGQYLTSGQDPNYLVELRTLLRQMFTHQQKKLY